MYIYKAISIRIFELSIKYDKTFYQISKISGLPKSTVRAIAIGVSKNPSITNIEKIAKAFNISLCEFFNDDKFRNINN